MTYKVYVHTDTHIFLYKCIVSYHYQSQRLFQYYHLKGSNRTVCDRFWLFGVFLGWLQVFVDGCGCVGGWIL